MCEVVVGDGNTYTQFNFFSMVKHFSLEIETYINVHGDEYECDSSGESFEVSSSGFRRLS